MESEFTGSRFFLKLNALFYLTVVVSVFLLFSLKVLGSRNTLNKVNINE